MKAVEAINLVKIFGNIKALAGLTFYVNEGEIFGLIGPNGAGKTTVLRIIATLIRPTSGMAKVFGLDVERENSKVRKIISYLPEEAGAYRNLSGLEYLEFMANFYSKDKDETESMVEEAAKISGLRSRLKDKVKTYSKGMTRRLLVARALMIHPKLAILDEPTSGLDVVHAIHVRRIIQEYVKKHNITVLLSSHNMLEVEFLCDRISLINNGKILAEGTPHEIKSMYNSDNLEDAFIEATKSG